MKSTRDELLGVLCNLYIVFLLAVLPLYTGGSYFGIGDAKYRLFRDVSLLVLVIWLVLEGIFVLRKGFSVVDVCVLSYGGTVVLSALCSSFSQVAWWGYRDWYMGAVSQLMFVGIYFVVSRSYDRNVLPVYLGEAAFLAVVCIGLLNRLGVDPVRLLLPFHPLDWEYSHMLSTIGNINWLCGYFSVMLALPMAGYLYSNRKWKQGILFVISALGLTLLCIQGSDSGWVLAGTGMGICLLFCKGKPERFRKLLLLGMSVCLLIRLMGWGITALGTQAATPIDGDAYKKMLWNGWWLLAAVLGIALLLHGYLSGRARKMVARFLVVSAGMTAVLLIGLYLLQWAGREASSWDSGRALLWRKSIEGLGQAKPLQLLVGAGPDCFAEYLCEIGIPPVLDTEGRWTGAIYANAHNEWLTQLLNLGVLGAAAYLAVFVSALKRYRGMLLGVLALGMYLVHSLVSFQQVMNAPLLFLVLGLCENQCRRAELIKQE